MILSDGGIIVKKVPAIMGPPGNTCPESDYKVLEWNENSCRFE